MPVNRARLVVHALKVPPVALRSHLGGLNVELRFTELCNSCPVSSSAAIAFVEWLGSLFQGHRHLGAGRQPDEEQAGPTDMQGHGRSAQ